MKENAAYIAAASPDVVLALIEKLEQLEQEAMRLKIELHDMDSSGAEMAKDYRQLEREADWLALKAWKKSDADYLPEREHNCWECPYEHNCAKCWREAARKAVEDGEK